MTSTLILQQCNINLTAVHSNIKQLSKFLTCKFIEIVTIIF